MYDDFYVKAGELMARGEPFATATVVRAEAPTSGKPGDKAIVTLDGVMHGWIGGSCAQPTVIREALAALAQDRARLVRLSPHPDEAPREGVIDLPMSCYSGGTLELFIEPQHPAPRLLVVGTLPVARALAQLATAMSYRVMVLDLEGTESIEADLVLHDLDSLAEQVTPTTYVVIATHGDHDEAALERVLAAAPRYVGLVASPTRATAIRESLRGAGLDEAALAPLVSPAGLDIHARRGDEIALSIMAQIVARRRTAEALDLARLGAALAPATPTAVAIDPICHMEVTIAGATHVSEYNGHLYYFCCAGCQRTFEAEPTQYLSTQATEG